MLAFEVSVNGKRVCTAGMGDYGVLTSILTWVRRRPAESLNGARIEEELTFEVSALESRKPNPGEHLKWLSEALHVGDSVSIRIVEVDTADPPVERSRQDVDAIERSRRAYYERLKREYE
jgi:hypothetical protein